MNQYQITAVCLVAFFSIIVFGHALACLRNNERLERENKRLRDLLSDPGNLDILLDKLIVETRGDHLGARWLVASFKDSMSNAVNCVELVIGDPRVGEYVVTVIRKNGLTPLDQLVSAEIHLREVLEVLWKFAPLAWQGGVAQQALSFLDRPKHITGK